MSELRTTDLEWYGFVDPSGGKDKLKKLAARSAIVVAGHDHLGRVFVTEAWAARCSTEHFAERILDTCTRYRFRAFGIEANAMQSLFVDLIIRDARLRGINVPLQPVYQPTHLDKDFRIRQAIQPTIGFGKLFIRNGLTELMTEVANFPLLTTRDLVDALASIIRMIPQRPNRVQRSSESDALAAYLRAAGVPAHNIEHRIAELDRSARQNPMEEYNVPSRPRW